MKVSVVIPTYNGAHKLPDILQALKDQSYKDFEIIIAIDGSTDNTIYCVQNLQFGFENLSVIIEDNKGRAAIRNRGAEASRGQLLIFFDDDMIPKNTCVEEHVKHHQQFPGTIVTGSQIDISGTDRNDIQNYKARLSRKWSEPLKSCVNQALSKDQLFLTAANFSIDRQLFFQIGCFDERLTDAEDYDFAIRAIKKNIHLYYNHNAFAWHNDVITGKSYIRRIRQYQKAHEQLQSLKPEIHEKKSIHKVGVIANGKRLLIHFFANNFWVNWMDDSKWKKWIPSFIRYKLYDFIITANGVYFPEKVPL